MTRVVFMGSSSFSVPALRALLEAGYEIAAVVTQPDRPAGRFRRIRPGPVKALALEKGLPLWQPETLRTPEARERLRALAPHLIVVAAYGEILRPEVLDLPPHGCVNLHPSLLPRWRGPSPVAAAILAGDRETGVTLIRMDAGMDTGPILAQEVLPLSGRERQGELLARLAEMAADLLVRTLPAWLAGEVVPRPQGEEGATYCRPLRKEDGQVDWERPAEHIERMVRAYDPWPGTYTFLRGRRLHIWRAAVWPETLPAAPGTVHWDGQRLLVATGEGSLSLEEVQWEGKRRLPIRAFLLGQRALEGARLGVAPTAALPGVPGALFWALLR
ncbi:MAG: methionyl-tRNA formyltransferase [Chloroflexia bacterium]